MGKSFGYEAKPWPGQGEPPEWFTRPNVCPRCKQVIQVGDCVHEWNGLWHTLPCPDRNASKVEYPTEESTAVDAPYLVDAGDGTRRLVQQPAVAALVVAGVIGAGYGLYHGVFSPKARARRAKIGEARSHKRARLAAGDGQTAIDEFKQAKKQIKGRYR